MGMRYADARYQPYRDENGIVSGVVINVRDITDQQLANEQLKKSHTLYQQAERLGSLGYFEWDEIEDRLISGSERFANIYGITVEEGLERFSSHEAGSQVMHKDDREYFHKAVMEARERNEGLDIEYRVIHRSGDIRHVHHLSRGIFDEDGKLLRSIGTMQDITERKLAEEQIEKSRSLFAQAEEMGKLRHWEWDEIEHRLISCSNEYARIFGMSVEEVLEEIGTSEDDLRFIHPDDQQRYVKADDGSWEEGEIFDIEYRLITRTGEVVYVHEKGEPVFDESGRVIRTFGTLQDITERKLIEEEIFKRQVFSSQAEQLGRLGHWEWDYVGHRLSNCSEVYAQIHEMSVDEAIAFFSSGISEFEIVHPDDRDAYRHHIEETEEKRQGTEIEYRIITQSGNVRHLHQRSELNLDSDGEIISSFGTVQDISERKQVEKRLIASEEKHRLLMETMNHGVGVVDLSASFTFVNEKTCEVFGYPRDELIGKPLVELLDKENRQILQDQLEKREKGEYEPYDLTWIKKNGEMVDTLTAPAPIYDKDGNYAGSMATVTDITSRKQAEKTLRKSEEQLRNAQRMAQVGNWQWLYSEEAISLSEEMYRIYGLSKENDPFTLEGFLGILHPDDRDRLDNNVEQMKATGESDNSEYRVIWPDGSEHYVSSQREIIHDDDGHAIGLSGTVQEITDRKKAELDLKASEERARLYFNAGLIGMQITDRNFVSQEINDAYCEMLGYSREELLELIWTDYSHPDDLEIEMEHVERMLSGEINRYTMEKRYFRKDGSILYLNIATECIRQTSGEIDYYVAFFQDITARKIDEASLLFTQTAVDQSSDGIFWLKPDASFIYANDAVCQMYDYSNREMLTRHVWDIDSGFPESSWSAHWQDVKRKKTMTFEIRPHTKSGRQFDAEITLNFVEFRDEEYLCAIIRDITERKQTEIAIRKSEERARLYFNTNSLGMLIINSNYVMEEVNDLMCEMLGYSRGELFKISWPDFTHPEDMKLEEPLYLKLSTGEIDKYRLEKRYIRKNGEILYVHLSVEALRNPDDEADYYIAFVQDVTERKKIEDNLKLSERRFRSAFDNTVFGMALIDLDGNYFQVNPAFCKMLGYDEEELLQKSIKDVSPPEEGVEGMSRLEKILKGKLPSAQMEKQFLHKDGHVVWSFINLTIVRDAEDKPLYFVGQANDITGRKQVEAQLQEYQQSLEEKVTQRTVDLEGANKELQAFAHSVSHDLKAPLRSIEGFADMLREDYGETLEGNAHDYLSEIGAGAVRMGEMVDDLLEHATLGQGFVNVTEVDLDRLTKKIEQDLSSDLKESKGSIIIEGKLGSVAGHQVTMEALLQNILSNAIKYVGEGICPEVLVSRSETAEEHIIAVKDYGIGIEKEHQDRIFGIFERLHTGQTYQGTGIGLAIAEKAVQLHNGRLWLESELGTGTKFYFSVDKNLKSPVSDIA